MLRRFLLKESAGIPRKSNASFARDRFVPTLVLHEFVLFRRSFCTSSFCSDAPFARDRFVPTQFLNEIVLFQHEFCTRSVMSVNLGRIRPLRKVDLTKAKLNHLDPLSFADFEVHAHMKLRSTGAIAFMPPQREPDNSPLLLRFLRHMTNRYVAVAEHHLEMAMLGPPQGLAEVLFPAPAIDPVQAAMVLDIPPVAQVGPVQIPGLDQVPEGAEPQLVDLLLAQPQAGAAQPQAVVAPIIPPQLMAQMAAIVPHMSADDHKLYTATLVMVQRHETAVKEEQKAFTTMFEYIRTVTTPVQIAKLDSVITSRLPGTMETLKPFQAFTEYMVYLRRVCQVTPVALRAIILHTRDQTGTAETKQEFMLLLDIAEHFRMTIMDFDALHPTSEPATSREMEIHFIVARIAHDSQELMIIKSDAEKDMKLPHITLEAFIVARRQACQSDVLTVRERHAMDTATGKMSREEHLSNANASAMSAGAGTGWPETPKRPGGGGSQHAYGAQCPDEELAQQLYQLQCYQAQAYTASAASAASSSQAGAYGASAAASSSSSSSASAYGMVGYGAGRGYAPPPNPRQRNDQAMVAWRDDTPVPVPQPVAQPMFAPHDQYQRPPPSHLRGQESERPMNTCRGYPFCNFNQSQRGCDYVHVPRHYQEPRAEMERQRWHDEERRAGRQGGAECWELSQGRGAGGTPGAEVKRSRYT